MHNVFSKRVGKNIWDLKICFCFLTDRWDFKFIVHLFQGEFGVDHPWFLSPCAQGCQRLLKHLRQLTATTASFQCFSGDDPRWERQLLRATTDLLKWIVTVAWKFLCHTNVNSIIHRNIYVEIMQHLSYKCNFFTTLYIHSLYYKWDIPLFAHKCIILGSNLSVLTRHETKAGFVSVRLRLLHMM